MKFGTSLSDGRIYRQDPARKCGKYMRIHPCPKHSALCWITTLGQKHTDFQLLDCDHRQIQVD